MHRKCTCSDDLPNALIVWTLPRILKYHSGVNWAGGNVGGWITVVADSVASVQRSGADFINGNIATEGKEISSHIVDTMELFMPFILPGRGVAKNCRI